MSAKKLAGIAYEERGSGFPFIALHGYTLDRRMSLGAFEPLFDAEGRARLPPAAGSQKPRGGPSDRLYRRIYPDLPFMGESADLGPGAGSDDMLDALCAFIDEVLPAGPFLLAGESYGGYIARGIALRMPERVEGAFFLCPLVVARRERRDLPPPAMLSEEPGWAAFAAGADPAELAEYEDCAVSRSSHAFGRVRGEILPGIRASRAGALAELHERGYAYSFDGLGAAAVPAAGAAPTGAPFDRLFEAPACFFLGRQDRSVGWRDALRLSDRYPRASYIVADAAGHNAQIEQAGLFAAAFGAWIADCEAWAGRDGP